MEAQARDRSQVPQPTCGTAHRPEWAIAGSETELAVAEASGGLRPTGKGWAADGAAVEALEFNRLVSGSEFCRHLLPSRTTWGSTLALAERRGVPLSLMTPPLTQDELPLLEALLGDLSGTPGAEVVANDWGTLRLARRRFPRVRPVLGRCLRRHKKDPRVEGLRMPGAVSPDVLEALAGCGVELVEADWLPDEPSPIALALHLPYAFVASGSLCPLSGLHRPVEEKFRPDRACDSPCSSLRVRLSDPATGLEATLHGNTLLVDNHVLPAGLTRPDVARLVYDLTLDREMRFLGSGPGGSA